MALRLPTVIQFGSSDPGDIESTSMDTEFGRPGSSAVGTDDRRVGTRRLSTETKSAYKTTEFLTYVVVFAGILVASFLVKTARTASGSTTSGRQGLVVHHPVDHRLHDRPGAGQVRQPRALRRRPPLAAAWAGVPSAARPRTTQRQPDALHEASGCRRIGRVLRD